MRTLARHISGPTPSPSIDGPIGLSEMTTWPLRREIDVPLVGGLSEVSVRVHATLGQVPRRGSRFAQNRWKTLLKNLPAGTLRCVNRNDLAVCTTLGHHQSNRRLRSPNRTDDPSRLRLRDQRCECAINTVIAENRSTWRDSRAAGSSALPIVFTAQSPRPTDSMSSGAAPPPDAEETAGRFGHKISRSASGRAGARERHRVWSPILAHSSPPAFLPRRSAVGLKDGPEDVDAHEDHCFR